MPRGRIPREFERLALETLQEEFSNFVPTTYEVSHMYIQNELMKPEGRRDLLREMCLFIVVDAPENRKLWFISERTEQLIEVPKGIVFPLPGMNDPTLPTSRDHTYRLHGNLPDC
jgi:hypothetical protein